jgi:hypothetical protein
MSSGSLKTCGKAAVALPFVGAALAGNLMNGSIVLAVSAAFYCWIRPRSQQKDREDNLDPKRRGICTDRYSSSKVPENLDVIIIGSGMSGLTCGAILARTGKRVLVLEQHDRTGGGTHTYDLGPGASYTFDSGLHYAIPECGKLLQLCTGGREPPVYFDLMGEPDQSGGMTYDRIFIGDERPFDIMLWQKHVPELYKRFPEHKADIDRYIKEAREAVDSIPTFVLSKLLPLWLQELLGPIILRTFRKQASRTMKETLSEITRNPGLAALLGSLWIDTGCPPEDVRAHSLSPFLPCFPLLSTILAIKALLLPTSTFLCIHALANTAFSLPPFLLIFSDQATRPKSSAFARALNRPPGSSSACNSLSSLTPFQTPGSPAQYPRRA